MDVLIVLNYIKLFFIRFIQLQYSLILPKYCTYTFESNQTVSYEKIKNNINTIKNI